MRKMMILLMMIMSFAFIGCWDSVETEDLGVIRTIGFSMGKNKDIKVVVQEIPHKKQTAGNMGSSGGPQSSFFRYSSSGSTVSEAIQKMSANEHHRLYFAHAMVIVLDEDLVASKGIEPILDFFERNPQIRLNAWLLVSPKGQFDKITSIDLGIGTDTGQILEETVHNKEGNSMIAVTSLGDFIELYDDPGAQAYAAGVNINAANIGSMSSNSGMQKFYVRDTAVFKNGKLAGWFKDEEFNGFSWIKGQPKGSVVNISLGEEVISLRTARFKRKFRPVIKNGKMEMNIDLKVVSNIAESQARSNFLDMDKVSELAQLQNEKIKSEITKAFEKSISLDSDVFGVGSYFHMSFPGFWKKVENKWDSEYKEVKINLHVDSSVNNIGTTYRSLFKQKE